MTSELAIFGAVALPFLAGVPIVLMGARPNLREGVSLMTAFIVFVLVAFLYPGVAGGEEASAVVGTILPGIAIGFTVEPLGMIFAGLASFLWMVTTIYSIGYMRGYQERNQTRFYAYFAIAIGAALGVAFAGNLLTLFVFYEALTLSTYPLVAHHGTEEAKRAGRVYLGLLLGTSIALLLLAIVWTWTLAGTVDFRAGGILAGKAEGPIVGVLLALYMFGIGKAALMPFHRWLPAAMIAPVPVSALLHAVAVVKAGVFAIVKIVVYTFGTAFLADHTDAEWLIYASGFTVIVASVIALRQDNLKLRLAYSTVSQLAYVVIAAAVLTPLSIVGAVLHIAAHAFGKITLFFAAGSIAVAADKTLVSELAGIGRRMPWTMAAFALASLSMIGLPPTAGFVSKWYILQGAWAAQQMTVVAVIVVSTLLNAAYFLPIVYAAFFRDESAVHGEHGEAPLSVVFALTVTAVGTVVLFFLPETLLGLARSIAGG